jgi:hypothetical protein
VDASELPPPISPPAGSRRVRSPSSPGVPLTLSGQAAILASQPRPAAKRRKATSSTVPASSSDSIAIARVTRATTRGKERDRGDPADGVAPNQSPLVPNLASSSSLLPAPSLAAPSTLTPSVVSSPLSPPRTAASQPLSHHAAPFPATAASSIFRQGSRALPRTAHPVTTADIGALMSSPEFSAGIASVLSGLLERSSGLPPPHTDAATSAIAGYYPALRLRVRTRLRMPPLVPNTTAPVPDLASLPTASAPTGWPLGSILTCADACPP